MMDGWPSILVPWKFSIGDRVLVLIYCQNASIHRPHPQESPGMYTKACPALHPSQAMTRSWMLA